MKGLNLGCGRVILPAPRPKHHVLIPEVLYTDPAIEWTNVDRADVPGVNVRCDLFRYPWALPDDTYEVAIAAHLVEHIPHAIIREGQTESLTGGWFAWWNELGRVLKPGGVAHILCPYAWSWAGVMDPTHTRYMLFESFGYLAPTEDAPFEYPVNHRWEMVGSGISFTSTAWKEAEAILGDDTAQINALLRAWSVHRLNIISEIYIALRVAK